MIWLLLFKLVLVLVPLYCGLGLAREYAAWKNIPIKEYELLGYKFDDIEYNFMAVVVDTDAHNKEHINVWGLPLYQEAGYRFKGRICAGNICVFLPFYFLGVDFLSLMFLNGILAASESRFEGNDVVLCALFAAGMFLASFVYTSMQRQEFGESLLDYRGHLDNAHGISDEQARIIEEKELVTGIECLQWLKHANEQEYRWQRWLPIPAALFLGFMIYRLFLYF